MDKHIQEDYGSFVSQVYISHMDCGHLMGRIYILKHIHNTMCNVNIYIYLQGLWQLVEIAIKVFEICHLEVLDRLLAL